MNPPAADTPGRGLEFVIAADYEALSRQAADMIGQEVRRGPGLLLCAAAGATPRWAYDLLAEAAERDRGLFRELRVVKIDEWSGIAPADPASCEADLRRHLLTPLEVAPERYAGFDGLSPEPEAECARVRAWLAANGPIDLCVVGIGTNGHIGMNEPADALQPTAHVARLAPASRRHPMLAATSVKPELGLTLGMGELLQARKILLLASGESKRKVVARLREPAVTPHFPASFLWLHPNVTVLCDEAAGGPAA